MSTILEHIRARGADIRLVGGRLQVRGALTDEVRNLIREHKPELIAVLSPIGVKPNTTVRAATPAPLGPGLSPELQAQRWGPALGHDLPPIRIEHPDPVAQAKAIQWADQADPYARAERLALAQNGGPT